MTAPTPEQMRALADDGDDRADYVHARTPDMVRKLTAALRAAADQLEAVQAMADRLEGPFSYFIKRELCAILTADTAPQEPDVGHYDGDIFVPQYPASEQSRQFGAPQEDRHV